MTKLIEQLRGHDLPQSFSDTELKNILSGGDQSRYSSLKRAVASGEIIHLRRGLYCLSEPYRQAVLNLYVIAQRIYGPSFISFESALSYHGWIPEAACTVSSACLRRSQNFKTPLGNFDFVRVPARIFFAGVERIESGPDLFFMARPWRAIADYVYAGGKKWRGIHPLIHSLRIDEEELRKASRDELEDIDRSFGNGRVSAFIHGVIEDLGL